MQHRIQIDEEDGRAWLRVPLDPETSRRLTALANICHAKQESVAASLLHDLLKEDEEAHFLLGETGPVGHA